MNENLMPYQLFADAVLVLHVGIVVFIIGGLAVIIAGNLRSWSWVNAMGFRVAHIAAIGLVVAASFMGLVCPLTTLEMWLRTMAGSAAYEGGFIEHWLQRILYYHGPAWAFTMAYTLFGFAVAAVWWCFPPRLRRRLRNPDVRV